MVLLLVSNFLETSLGIVTFIYLVSPQVVLLLSQAVGLICAGGWLAVVVRYARKILQQETDQVNTGGAVMPARGSQGLPASTPP